MRILENSIKQPPDLISRMLQLSSARPVVRAPAASKISTSHVNVCHVRVGTTEETDPSNGDLLFQTLLPCGTAAARSSRRRPALHHHLETVCSVDGGSCSHADLGSKNNTPRQILEN